MQSDFRNLVVWQLAVDLADAAYDVAEALPHAERSVLGEQMRDAALSVPSNIAEGKGRWSVREYRQFVRHARGSLMELQSHILFARRRAFISEACCDELIALAENLAVKINRLIQYLNRRAKRPNDRERPTTDDRAA